MTLTQLSPKHYPALYDITNVTDTWVKRTVPEHIDFFSQCSGWVIEHQSKVVGYIILMNYVPTVDVTIHCSVLPAYQSKWMTKGIYKTVFNHIFDTLKVNRCTSYLIDGYSNPTFLDRLGFKQEGVLRRAYPINNSVKDIILYGMLPDERRWK